MSVGLSCPAKNFIWLVIVKQIAGIPAGYCYYIVIIIIIIIIYYYSVFVRGSSAQGIWILPTGEMGTLRMSILIFALETALTLFTYFFD